MGGAMKAWIFVLAMMALSPSIATGAEADTGAHTLTRVPPKYPPEAARAGATGTVVLIISVSAAGAIENVLVERSSGNRLLDTAAIDAVNEWTFAPAIEHGKPARGRVRVPVDFNMGNEDEPVREAVAKLPARLRVPPVVPDASGTVPQFIGDPLPLDAGSVAAIVALLQAHGTPIDLPELPPGVSLYTLEGESGKTQWEIYTGDIPHAPTAVRKRMTHDGTHGFLVTRVLCESKDADACAHFLAHVERPARQRAVPLKAPAGKAESTKSAAPGR